MDACRKVRVQPTDVKEQDLRAIFFDFPTRLANSERMSAAVLPTVPLDINSATTRMVYQGARGPLFCEHLAFSAITAGTFPDVRRNCSDAQSPSTPSDAQGRLKGTPSTTATQRDGNNIEDEPTLPLRWTLQGLLGATEQALQPTLLSAPTCFKTTTSYSSKQLLQDFSTPPTVPYEGYCQVSSPALPSLT
jgi:hypothetical protein